MNYYERHLGDYARDTAHLSMLEHGAYGLLLDRYYATEKPIPADQVHRLARARSKEERQAVDDVLAEFFTLVDGAWMNARAELEIAKKESKTKAAQENGRNGGRPKKHSLGSEKVTQQKPTGLFLGSENETQQKAHQTPDTSNQTPVTSNQEERQLPDQLPSRAGAVCVVVKSAGIGSVNPQHPKLLELLADGAQVQEFEDAARKAADAGKGFAYALGIVKNAREDAKRQPVARSTQAESFRERDDRLARERIESICPSIAAKAPRSRNVIDITGTLTETIGAIA